MQRLRERRCRAVDSKIGRAVDGFHCVFLCDALTIVTLSVNDAIWFTGLVMPVRLAQRWHGGQYWTGRDERLELLQLRIVVGR
jgi:hypothetical protein